MDVTLNRSHIQEAYEVFKHLQDRRSSALACDRVLVRSEPGKVALVGTNGDVDVFHQTPAPENQPAAQFLVPLIAMAFFVKGQAQ